MAEDQGRETAGRAWEPLGETDPWDVGRHAPLDLTALEGVCILVGTKKGAFFITSDAAREHWTVQGPVFFGYIVHHIISDPRDRDTILIAARTGHLGPTVFRSNDRGQSWREATQPPAFAEDDPHERVVEQVFHLTPGNADQPNVWYAGISPETLFRSDDGGDSWSPVSGWNDHHEWLNWTDGGRGPDLAQRQQSTPDGSPLHSILIDPRDAAHLYVAHSSGGVFESSDNGVNWIPMNTGCEANFLPDPYPEIGQDPHCVILHPDNPDVLYQQNHCGIYRLDRPATVWDRIGDNMPPEIGDIGFAITPHPRDVDTVWVFPMDGTDVWPRTSVAARPAVYCTRDGGKSWLRQDNGLPVPGWYTVYRQAMACDARDPVGVYFGATCGEIWGSRDEGESWQMLAGHLPQVYAVEAFDPGA